MPSDWYTKGMYYPVYERVLILKKDPPPQCEHCQCTLTVCHILVECNHLEPTRKDIFGRRDVVGCFKFHPEFILKNFKDISFIINFNFIKSVIFVFFTALYAVFL